MSKPQPPESAEHKAQEDIKILLIDPINSEDWEYYIHNRKRAVQLERGLLGANKPLVQHQYIKMQRSLVRRALNWGEVLQKRPDWKEAISSAVVITSCKVAVNNIWEVS